MALARNRRSNRSVDYWPGFVDALSTLLLAIMFLLTVFVIGQFILTDAADHHAATAERGGQLVGVNRDVQWCSAQNLPIRK